jgi:transposase
VREFDHIAIGNVHAKALARTGLAKAVLDASWSSFRTMLAYKSVRDGAIYEEVDEAFSTQTCSACGCISGPKGRAGLNERQWVCGDCGCKHDRDVNASLNLLLRSGHRTPVQGIPAL